MKPCFSTMQLHRLCQLWKLGRLSKTNKIYLFKTIPPMLLQLQGAHWVLQIVGTMGYNCCFFLNFVPLHIESSYNFGDTGPILGGKNPSAESKWACWTWLEYNVVLVLKWFASSSWVWPHRTSLTSLPISIEVSVPSQETGRTTITHLLTH